jgi:hypothetical protein
VSLTDNNEDFIEVCENADVDSVAVLAYARAFITLSVSTVNVVARNSTGGGSIFSSPTSTTG